MFAGKKTNRPWKMRKQYVVDRPMQMGIAAYLMSGLCGVALLCAGALYVFLSGSAIPGLDALQRFLLVANATYFVLAAGVLTMLTIILTHRFAGPAFVMRNAIRGMLEGDYTRRLELRKKDYLKALAADFDELRDLWMRHDESNRYAFDALERAVEDGDTEKASQVIARLREGLMVRPKTDDETRPAPSKERETVSAS